MSNLNKKIIILSPPFYSHFQPLKTLGKALKLQGAQVSMACSDDFKKETVKAGLGFYTLNINKNQNTGIAKNTLQDQSEKKRLEEFFSATYRGPVSTLITQADHRIRDMFSNPQELIYSIRQLNEKAQPDLVIADQLSYGVTLALVGLEIPFVTYCPPHPETIQSHLKSNGLTELWPKAVEPSDKEKLQLAHKQNELQTKFSEIFRQVFHSHFPEKQMGENFLTNPFSLTSSKGVIFNYPKFTNRALNVLFNDIPSYYLHYCFEPEKLEDPLKTQVLKEKKKKVLISFGTFLSERRDVIEKLIRAFLEHQDSWHIYVAAGGNDAFYQKFSSDRVTSASFLPQKALLPHMDLVVHHGGANTFTETLYYGKPMIVLPFSSDQFAVGYDAESNRIGEVLNPNDFTKEELDRAIDHLFTEEINKNLSIWQLRSREMGPADGARWIMSLL